MRIDLNKVFLKNFMSFEQAEVILKNTGYILVNGINENPDDLARSNGSGKSTLFEAIAWSLTGETIRGSKDVKRLGSDGECSVTLNLTVDGNEYEITRTKDPSNLKVFINQEDKSGKGIRDTEKLLAEYLPDLTAQLIGSVIILGQGLPQRFTNNTPSGRKEVLEQLSKSDFMIEDLKKRIGTRKNELANLVRATEDAILVANTKLQTVENQLAVTKDALDKLPTADVYELQIEMSQKQVDENKSKLDEVRIERDQLVNEITLNSSEIQKVYKEYQDKCSVIEQEYRSKEDECNIFIASKKADIRNLSDEIKKLKEVKEFCPTCGQRLPDVHIVDTSDKEAELGKIKAEVTEKEQELNEYYSQRATKLLEEKNIYEAGTADVNNTKKDLQFKYNQINKEFTQLNMVYNQAVADLERAKLGLQNLENTRTGYETAIQNFNIELVDLNDKLTYNNNEKNRLEAHTAVITRMATLITRDFRGYLLTNVIEFINKKAKEYAADVFETDKIEFTIDGNNISISYDGKEYECLSGGEKQKIDLIVQLSIRDMLCTFLGFSCNCLIVDELFDGLDDIGCQKVINLISTKLTDVQTIYIVTHHTDIQIPCDGEIIVVKGADKISRIGG